MKVLYFHQYFATRKRSTATRSYELARRLVERGHQVTIVSRDTRALEHGRDERPTGGLVARETVDGIDVVYITMPYSNYMSTPLRIASFIGFTKAAAIAGLVLPKPDVVFATSTPLTIGIPGLLVSRLKGVPFVFEIRDLWPAVPIQLGVLRNPALVRAAEWLESLLYREAQRVVVLSEGSRDSLIERGVPAEKLVFVPNASDTDLFSPDVVDADFRARHGLEDAFIALYTGAMGRANGLGQALDAARVLHGLASGGGPEAGTAGRVAIVCLGDGSERPRVQAKAQELGLTNLLFLDPVAKEELAGIVGASDVTLTLFAPRPILETNSPNKFFDSLAAGKPAVVNLDGWLRRLVEENGAGAYVPGADGAALAALLLALASEPDVVGRMSANARALAEREFDRDLMADRLAVALEEVAATPEGDASSGSASPGAAAPAARPWSRRRGVRRASGAPSDNGSAPVPAVVLGQLHAGLSMDRALGRRGVPVHGIAFHDTDFAMTSRYLRSRQVFDDEDLEVRDRRTMTALRSIAGDGRIVLFPERDEHVGFCLRNWDELREFADIPLPPDPDITWSLRRKERLIQVAEAAGVPYPATVHATDEEAIRSSGLKPPFLIKPIEGQSFALHFHEKLWIVETLDEAVEQWRKAKDAGFETLVQEFIPNAFERIYSLLAYISTDGTPLVCVVGRKIRQGPLKFGSSAYFRVDYDERVLRQGVQLLTAAGYRGIAHVELAYDERDDTFKLIEVNTRTPVWFGLAQNRDLDLAGIVYDDLCCQLPFACQLYTDDLGWAYLAKDVYVSLQMARAGELDAREVVRDYRRPKVRATFAADDPMPALASLRYLLSRTSS
jgi:predicted ATP-grasp superfamily ATP-dependent carboligase/glycosyltransferase involved in cell wall biosynthesis